MQRILAEYLRQIDETGEPCLAGLHLVGSAALGDFRPGSSDVDLVAILAEEPGPGTIRALGAIHEQLARLGEPWLDPVYATLERLRAPERDAEPTPFVVGGVFHADRPCGDLNAVLRQSLVEHGRVIRGPAPATLGIPADRAATMRYVRGNLSTYWRRWIQTADAAIAARGPGGDVSAAALAQGALGVARIACTIETGRIVAKGAAALWAARRFPMWREPLERAELQREAGGRTGSDDAAEALDFMRFVVERYGAPATF